jgi:hypothetical protein
MNFCLLILFSQLTSFIPPRLRSVGSYVAA